MHLKFFQFVQITLDFLSKHQDALAYTTVFYLLANLDARKSLNLFTN